MLELIRDWAKTLKPSGYEMEVRWDAPTDSVHLLFWRDAAAVAMSFPARALRTNPVALLKLKSLGAREALAYLTKQAKA